jgi:hypothetical protein
VPADRVTRISAELSADGDGTWSSARLCEVTRDLTGVSGAGVMLMSGDVARGSMCTTNDVSNAIEELQYTLGEGPCVDALAAELEHDANFHYVPHNAAGVVSVQLGDSVAEALIRLRAYAFSQRASVARGGRGRRGPPAPVLMHCVEKERRR